MSADTLLLTRSAVAALMTPADYLRSARIAFGGGGEQPQPLSLHLEGGAFHAKGAAISTEGGRFAAVKVNGNFPGNAANGQPTIQGVVVLSDAADGRVLAVIDSIELTLQRTAAASALAALYLARDDAKSLAIIGCGAQAPAQIEALLEVRSFGRLALYDLNAARAQDLAKRVGRRLETRCARSASEAAREADVIVTCTTASQPFLNETQIRGGAFIAAVGADKAGKSEIAPSLMGRSRVFVDSLAQCVEMGDLRNAIVAGVMTRDDIAGDLAALVDGRVQGRRNAHEVAAFDSTGIGAQDVSAAAMIFERACRAGAGTTITFGE